MRRFARNACAVLLAGLTLLLTIAAASDITLSGWFVGYAAALGYAAMVCMYFGFSGEADE